MKLDVEGKSAEFTVPQPSVLEEAAQIVDGPRRAAYGNPHDNHQRTADLWSTYLGFRVTARQVCVLNMLQKISRDAHCPGRDNLVDIAGYARNAELVQEARDAARRECMRPDPLLQELRFKPHVGAFNYEVTTPLPPMGHLDDSCHPSD